MPLRKSPTLKLPARALVTFIVLLLTFSALAAPALASDYTLHARPWPPEGGVVTRTPHKSKYTAGDSVTLTATPAEGWAFAGWFGSFGTSDEAATSLTVEANVTAVAMFERSNKLLPERTLWGQGTNSYGALGDGTQIEHLNEFVQAVNMSRVVSVSATADATYIVREDGTVWACGRNYDEMITEGGDRVLTLTKLDLPSHIVEVAMAWVPNLRSYHVLALRGDGTVWAWGQNDYGQLGNGTTDFSRTAVQVQGLDSVVAISAGTSSSMALKADGSVWVWGYQYDGSHRFDTPPIPEPRLVDLPPVKAISCGSYFNLALLNDGTVRSWGQNYNGELGDGTDVGRIEPVAVSGLTSVKAIAAGGNHSLVLKNDGTVWAWGNNSWNQVGNKTIQNYLPVRVQGPTNVIAVSTGIMNSMALTSGGEAWIWGYINYHENGSLPKQIAVPEGTRAIKAADGQYYAIAPKKYDIQLTASPLAGGRPTITPNDNCTHGELVTIDAGTAADHDFQYWTGLEGLDVSGNGERVSFHATRDVEAQAVFLKTRLLLETKVSSAGAGWIEVAPRKASYEPGDEVSFVAQAAHGWQFVSLDVMQGRNLVSHDAANLSLTMDKDTVVVARFRLDPAGLLNGGTPYGWGYNVWGHVGDGTTLSRNYPVALSGLTRVVQMGQMIALKSDGTVWTWGPGTDGLLGDGTFDARSTPAQVPALSDVVQVERGYALKADGTVWSWGSSYRGRLGRTVAGSYDPIPAPIPDLNGITSICVGHYFAVALRADGSVWTWGSNSDQQLGDGTTTHRTEPAMVEGLPKIAAISAGEDYVYAIDSNGRLWGWGKLLDDFADTPFNPGLPTLSRHFRNLPLRAVSTSGTRMAIDDQHRLWAWGDNTFGQLGDGSKIFRSTPRLVPGMSNIASALIRPRMTMALTIDGRLYTWGNNSYGQLGLDDTNERLTPTHVSSLTTVTGLASGDITAWAITGTTHSLKVAAAPAERGQATANYSALIPGAAVEITARPLDPQWTVASVDGLEGVEYQQVTVDGVTKLRFNIYRDLDVRVNFEQTLCRIVTRAWPPSAGNVVATPSSAAVNIGSHVAIEAQPAAGWNFVGWRGFGFDTSGGASTEFDVHGNVLAVAVFERDQTATEPGRPFSWGDGAFGQLGNGSTDDRLTPGGVPGLPRMVKLAAGGDFSLALDEDGNVWSWGCNAYSQLGDGTVANRPTPAKIEGLSQIIDIAAGESHGLALKADGTVLAWGRNSYGQLGDGTAVTRSRPVVTQFRQAVNVSAGQYFSAALGADGGVWSCGTNNSGQLGDGTQLLRHLPVRAAQPRGLVQVDCGNNHTLAIAEDGTVWGWGYGIYGQLGDGGMSVRLTPVQMSNIDQAVQVSAGGNHSLVIAADGTLWNCGAHFTTRRLRPVIVAEVADVVAVAAGNTHSLAVAADGKAYAWGYNYQGELGLGDRNSRLSPVEVPHLFAATAVAAGNKHSLALGDLMVNLSIVDAAGGQVAGDPAGEYRYGSVVNQEATADDGYRFVGWKINGLMANDQPALELTMDDHKTVEVVFAFQLNLAVNNGSGSGIYDEGTVVQIAANVPEKYQFVAWTGDIDTVADTQAAETSITMTANCTVTATFEKIIYPLPVELLTDSDFVYQNTPQTTQDRHLVVLRIQMGDDLNDNTGYEITVEQTAGEGEVQVVATEDPMVWHLVGSRRGVGSIGQAVVTVQIAGNVAGESSEEVAVDVRLLGDIRPSGAVNAIDKALLIKHLNNIETGLPARAFDLNGNGFVEPTDKALMNALLNGIDPP